MPHKVQDPAEVQLDGHTGWNIWLPRNGLLGPGTRLTLLMARGRGRTLSSPICGFESSKDSMPSRGRPNPSACCESPNPKPLSPRWQRRTMPTPELPSGTKCIALPPLSTVTSVVNWRMEGLESPEMPRREADGETAMHTRSPDHQHTMLSGPWSQHRGPEQRTLVPGLPPPAVVARVLRFLLVRDVVGVSSQG